MDNESLCEVQSVKHLNVGQFYKYTMLPMFIYNLLVYVTFTIFQNRVIEKYVAAYES